jgi:hypothetical protein
MRYEVHALDLPPYFFTSRIIECFNQANALVAPFSPLISHLPNRRLRASHQQDILVILFKNLLERSHNSPFSVICFGEDKRPGSVKNLETK